jgi:hypothetical protein
VWVAAGALFTALAVVAVIQFGPWKKTAASGSPPPVEQSAPQPPPAQPQTPAPAPATNPEPQPASAPAPAQQQPPPLAQQKPALPAPKPKPAPAQRQPAAAASQAPMPQPQPIPAAPQPVQQQPPPPAPAPSGSSPAEQAARRAELAQVREQAAMLGTRATSVKATFQTMQRSQAASGLGMRGDMTEAAALVNTYMDGVHSALQAGDVAAAKDFMQKAERQVEKLEKFLGR